MLIHLLLTSLATLAATGPFPHEPIPYEPGPPEGSLLAAVPEDAFALAYCRDVAALRSRAERNDWVRLLGSPGGEPMLEELEHEFRRQTHTELGALLDLGLALHGESVFYFAPAIAGFVTQPPPDRDRLATAMRDWLPAGGAEALRREIELDGARVLLAAWPGEGAWSGRAGHFAAFVDHPFALGLFSAQDVEALMEGLRASLGALGSDHRAPVARGFAAAGGGSAASGAIELYVDFTPFAARADAALARSVEDVLPDPTGMLGLEKGMWLLATADVFPGTRVDCRARLRIPPDTLAARLADTFRPLPADLPARLPGDVWSLYALQWDLMGFYERARVAIAEKHGEESLQLVDQGLAAAQALSGIDPVEHVLRLLDGTFALYFADGGANTAEDELAWLLELGFLAGVSNGEGFLDAFEELVGVVGGLESALDVTDVEGVEVFSFDDEYVTGGLAFLPDSFVAAAGRDTLAASLRAQARVEGASMARGTPFQAAFDESLGACFFSCVAMSPLQARALPDLGDAAGGPPAEGDGEWHNPFDSHLVSSVRRTAEGFELVLRTR